MYIIIIYYSQLILFKLSFTFQDTFDVSSGSLSGSNDNYLIEMNSRHAFLTVSAIFSKIRCQLAVARRLLSPEVLSAYTQVLARHRVAFHLTIRQHPFATLVISLVREAR